MEKGITTHFEPEAQLNRLIKGVDVSAAEASCHYVTASTATTNAMAGAAAALS